MKKDELIELLSNLASEDLAEGGKLEDHPCIVACKALNECFEDIEGRNRIIERFYKINGESKIYDPYNPEW